MAYSIGAIAIVDASRETLNALDGLKKLTAEAYKNGGHVDAIYPDLVRWRDAVADAAAILANIRGACRVTVKAEGEA